MPTSTRRRVLSDGDHVDTNSPPLTRARAAAAATAGTPPAPREEADDRAATLPRDADDARAGIEPSVRLDSETDDDLDAAVAAAAAADAGAAAADALASRRRTEAHLRDLEESQQAPPADHAASQFAACGIEMHRGLLPDSATASVGLSALVGERGDDPGTLRAQHPRVPTGGVPPGFRPGARSVGIASRGLPAPGDRALHWTAANGYGRRAFGAASAASTLPAGVTFAANPAASAGGSASHATAGAPFGATLLSGGHMVPGLADEHAVHRKVAAVIRLRLVFLGASQPAGLIAHQLGTGIGLMDYALSESFIKAFSRAEWKPEVFGLDAFHRILSSAPANGSGTTAASPIDLVSGNCESYADLQAAAHFGAQLLGVINPGLGEQYVAFVLGLVRDPVFRSLGSRGVRHALRLVDDQLRVLLSSANAWATYVADNPDAVDLSLAPTSPPGVLSATSAYTADMVRLSLLRAVTCPAAAPAHPPPDKNPNSTTGPRDRAGKPKCPDFAFTGKCPRGAACTMSHDALTDAESDRWAISFRRRPYAGRPGAGNKTKRRPGPK